MMHVYGSYLPPSISAVSGEFGCVQKWQDEVSRAGERNRLLVSYRIVKEIIVNMNPLKGEVVPCIRFVDM